MTDTTLGTKEYIEITKQYGTNNYSPVEVVLTGGNGAWVTDVEGNKYLDMLSAYSAVNFGHCNPRIAKAALEQMNKLTLVSRAFHTDQFALLCRDMCLLTRMDRAIFMNSGAEAVETAIKIARKWGYEKKGIEADKAEIICFNGNFHGRTITITSFSDSEAGRKNFGPFTPGFKLVPFGDIKAVKEAVTKNTAAVLVEPIQGEGGVIIPPDGFLIGLRDLCDKNNVLMLADEIQTGLCRTGRLFACDHEAVRPDAYIIGKSLGGGITPISAVVGTEKVMDVLTPGTHGSTFGGNSFACAIAREVIAIIQDENPAQRAAATGEYIRERLSSIKSSRITALRGRGLMFGIDIDKSAGKAKDFCMALKEKGVLCKDTREQTIRLAPPLFIEREELDWALERIAAVFAD